jgi:hypothetical protein
MASEFAAATVLFALDTDDRVETDAAVGDTVVFGFDSDVFDGKVLAAGVFTTTSMAALSVGVAEGPGELAVTLADFDDDRPVPDGRCGVTCAPVALPVVSVEVEALWSLTSDDALDADVAAVD